MYFTQRKARKNGRSKKVLPHLKPILPLVQLNHKKTINNNIVSPLFFSADCLTWNATIAIWNASLPDQIGTLIDRFCPEISAKEYILNITTRKIVIR